MRSILIRLYPSDELIILVDEVSKKMRLPASSLVKIALYSYCKRVLSENGN